MSRILVADAGPLINFLVIDRADLFGLHPAKIMVTDHVVAEITESYPIQLARLRNALQQGMLYEQAIDQIQMVELFAKLRASGRLGMGECSSIAFSHFTGSSILMDDRQAIKAARELSSDTTIIGSADFIRELIALKHLSIAEADQILLRWAEDHRFRLPFQPFVDCANEEAPFLGHTVRN
ncbi:hypothetical protein [Rhizobium chutanense]|uniref:Uncharacterized protein n=1 Tax=Rhizobium chutanense TaxID=2035448 RepID=A0A3S0S538_9HYPH|nr:hypothetical protein [Rhizobium chutanense]RUM09732.1 hypothetical protein EFR84_00645 [Rhizobium chutanense]